MGLDITAFRQIAPAPEAETDEDGYPVDWENYFRSYVNDDFPRHAEGVEHETVYKFNEAMDFRAGSYGGYNDWRRWLASLVGTTPEAVWNDEYDGPFAELINFSDCEGIIGPVVSAKLARDFASLTPTGDDYNVRKFYEWRHAFEMAADGGCVKFH